MATIKVENLTKEFGHGGQVTRALDGISFTVEGPLFVSIVGPSGCGKSTLLNVLAGIQEPTSGTAEMLQAGRRAKLGYVFQTPRLLPWCTVMDNMLFIHAEADDATRERCRRYLEMVGLADVADKYPGQLSGGMQQRVGIARAFSIDPDVLLMDEPFSHLDAISARQLRNELVNIWMATHKTVLFVTHDVGEAVELSNRVVVMARGGRIREIVDIDLEYPREPADDRVALLKADLLRQFESWQEMVIS